MIADQRGTLTRHANFLSKHVAARNIDVWRPPANLVNPETPLPVIYMHDGQHIFDPKLCPASLDWSVDEAIVRLMIDYNLPAALVVGIWNSPARRREYMPARPLEGQENAARLQKFIQEQGGAPLSYQYLKFLVEELKPFVDAAYPTLPGQADTIIMGASMGGLISLYALVEYPGIFGGAGCLSSHWTIGGQVLTDYFGKVLPKPGSHRLYFDYGTVGLDEAYAPFQHQMDAHLKNAGYRYGHDWVTYKFDGAEHDAAAWRMRLEVPLAFLLTKQP